MEKFDVIIIGIGQAGGPLASTLSEKGFKTAIIERSHPGGSCVNYGCTPTKTMVASASVAYLSQNAGDFGIHNGQTHSNFKEIIERRDKIVAQWRQGVQKKLEAAENLEILTGEAHFIGKNQVEVKLNNNGESRKLEASQIFINVGTSPRVPEMEGLDKVSYYTAKSMMDLDELPEHLIILGGSYIGLEFGQMFRRFGSKVSIVETGPQLAGREDEDIAAVLQKILEREGLEFYLDSEVVKVAQEGNKISLSFQNKKRHNLTGSHLLIATGTTPNTSVLQLEKVGIETKEQGYIAVNEYLQTNVQGVFALGDCKGGPEFTHISYDDFRIVKDFLFGEKKRNTKDRPVPYTMFTKPELGRIGLTEKEAKEQGKAYKIAKMDVKQIARAVESNQMEGLIKVLVDAQNGNILGAACLAEIGGELMTILQVAMMGGLPYQQLRDGVFAHPTWAESLNNLFSNIEDPKSSQ